MVLLFELGALTLQPLSRLGGREPFPQERGRKIVSNDQETYLSIRKSMSWQGPVNPGKTSYAESGIGVSRSTVTPVTASSILITLCLSSCG